MNICIQTPDFAGYHLCLGLNKPVETEYEHIEGRCHLHSKNESCVHRMLQAIQSSCYTKREVHHSGCKVEGRKKDSVEIGDYRPSPAFSDRWPARV